jgi:hypothetical protein
MACSTTRRAFVAKSRSFGLVERIGMIVVYTGTLRGDD